VKQETKTGLSLEWFRGGF